jgi:hypothetical protein
MSNKFNFSDVQSDVQGSKYLTPGVHEGVTITGVTDGQTTNGKSVIKVGFSKNGQDLLAEWSMEGGAVPYTMRKIKHMLTKFYDEDRIKNIDSTEKVNAALAGKIVRLKVSGEEYLNKDGLKRVKPVVGLPNFCENIGSVKETETKLSYDTNNQYDLKRLPEVMPTSMVKDDLPF